MNMLSMCNIGFYVFHNAFSMGGKIIRNLHMGCVLIIKIKVLLPMLEK
jgi:hypothetical protein